MIPKIIWRYWETGWDTIKWPLEYCTESIKHYAPDWEVRDLDGESVKKYIELPEEVWNIPIQTRSDVIRIMLLAKYGGCWIDATIFLNTNLTDYLSSRCKDFFCFWRWEKKETVSSWFLAATENSYIAKVYEDVFLKYVTSEKFKDINRKYYDKWNGSPDYFCFHREFESYIKKDAEFKKHIEEMPFESSVPIMLPIYNDYCKTITVEYLQFVLNNTPMFKFSHRRSEIECKTDSIIPILLKKMNGQLESELLSLSLSLPHNSMSQRSSFLYNSFLDKPEMCKEYAGVFDSESDMKLSTRPASKYHVFNFSSHDYKNNCQILIPYGQNKIYFRKQSGNKFDAPQELIFKSELESYKEQINKELVELRDLYNTTQHNTTQHNTTQHYPSLIEKNIKKSIKEEIMYA